MLKSDINFVIELYKKAITELQEDLKLVKNETTKILIQEEIEHCERRIIELKGMVNDETK